MKELTQELDPSFVRYALSHLTKKEILKRILASISIKDPSFAMSAISRIKQMDI